MAKQTFAQVHLVLLPFLEKKVQFIVISALVTLQTIVMYCLHGAGLEDY